jgi:DNA-binding FadR family transcriptional regulator
VTPVDDSERGPAHLPIEYRAGIERPLKAAEAIARDIVHQIVERGLVTGDHLPSEAQMLRQHRVSRQSLREALRLLEVQGLIGLRRGPGGGPVVGKVDSANFGRVSTLYYHLVGISYEELIEAWAYAEGQLAQLAAQRADRTAVQTELRIYAETSPSTDDELQVDEYVDLQSRFHYVLARNCGNRALQLTLSSFGPIVAHHLLLELDPRGMGKMVAEQHRAIARAVVNGKHQLARTLSEAHIHDVADTYKNESGDTLTGLVEWR